MTDRNTQVTYSQDDVVLQAFSILGNTRIQLHNLCNQANRQYPKVCQEIMGVLSDVDKIGATLYKLRIKKDGLL